MKKILLSAVIALSVITTAFADDCPSADTLTGLSYYSMLAQYDTDMRAWGMPSSFFTFEGHTWVAGIGMFGAESDSSEFVQVAQANKSSITGPGQAIDYKGTSVCVYNINLPGHQGLAFATRH